MLKFINILLTISSILPTVRVIFGLLTVMQMTENRNLIANHLQESSMMEYTHIKNI